MKLRVHKAIVTAVLALGGQHAYAQASLDPFVQTFMLTCESTSADPSQVSEAARREHFAQITSEAAYPFLNGEPGTAWSKVTPGNTYAVTLSPEGRCSVFVQEGDADELKKAIESWLPPPGSGIAVAKDELAAPQGLRSFRYVLQGGNVHEEWVLTVCLVDLPKPLRAIVTYRGL